MKQHISMPKKKNKLKFPKDWKVYRLGDLGDFLKGKGISKKDRKESGIPCILYGEIYTKHHFYVKEFVSFIDNKTASKSMRLEKGDILFTGSGETREEIGKPVAYLDDREAYAGGDIIILRPKNINSLFLSYLLNSEHQIKERARLAEGHSVVHIYPNELKSIRVHIPTLLEQKKIAAILSTWDKAIELKEKLIEQKKELKKGLMQKLLTGEVRLPGFEGEWIEYQVGEICTLTRGRVISKKEMEENIGIYPVYSSQTSNEGKIGSIDTYDFDGEYVTWTTDGANAGTVFYRNGKFNCTNVCGVLKLKREDIDARYLAYVLASNTGRYVVRHGNPKLMNNIMEIIPVKIFNNFEFQKYICDFFDIVDKEINLIEKETNELKQQKKGLMQLLLTGKVRVKV